MPSLKTCHLQPTIWKFLSGSMTSLADIWALVCTNVASHNYLGFFTQPSLQTLLLQLKVILNAQAQPSQHTRPWGPNPALPSMACSGDRPPHPSTKLLACTLLAPQPISHQGLSSLSSYSSPSISSSHPHGNHPPQPPAPFSSHSAWSLQ